MCAFNRSSRLNAENRAKGAAKTWQCPPVSNSHARGLICRMSDAQKLKTPSHTGTELTEARSRISKLPLRLTGTIHVSLSRCPRNVAQKSCTALMIFQPEGPKRPACVLPQIFGCVVVRRNELCHMHLYRGCACV